MKKKKLTFHITFHLSSNKGIPHFYPQLITSIYEMCMRDYILWHIDLPAWMWFNHFSCSNSQSKQFSKKEVYLCEL